MGRVVPLRTFCSSRGESTMASGMHDGYVWLLAMSRVEMAWVSAQPLGRKPQSKHPTLSRMMDSKRVMCEV